MKQSKVFAKIFILALIFTTLFMNEAFALPDSNLFDSEPADLKEARVADSSCTQYGITYTRFGTEQFPTGVPYLWNDSNIYACANDSREFIVGFVGVDGIALEAMDVFAILPNGKEIEMEEQILTSQISEDEDAYELVFITKKPIPSGSKVIINAESDTRLIINSKIIYYPQDVDFYLLVP